MNELFLQKRINIKIFLNHYENKGKDKKSKIKKESKAKKEMIRNTPDEENVNGNLNNSNFNIKKKNEKK